MKRRDFISNFIAFFGGLFSFRLVARPLPTICGTDPDVQGPFFRSGAPLRVNLAAQYTGTGVPLHVKGKVRASNCNTPVVGAAIEIWHASPEGMYDLTSNQFLFRGRMETNSNGEYEFHTLMPKGYRDGPLDRPKHIHYKVNAAGFKELVTQLYFEGDPKLDHDLFVIQNNGKKRALPVINIADGTNSMLFDLYLTES